MCRSKSLIAAGKPEIETLPASVVIRWARPLRVIAYADPPAVVQSQRFAHLCRIHNPGLAQGVPGATAVGLLRNMTEGAKAPGCQDREDQQMSPAPETQLAFSHACPTSYQGP